MHLGFPDTLSLHLFDKDMNYTQPQTKSESNILP